MRTALKRLENQLVFCHGRVIKKTKRFDDGTMDILVSPVTVKAWDGHSSIDSIPQDQTEKIDHLWLRADARNSARLEMLQRAGFIGRIGYYTRADGSVDLAVNTVPAVSLEELLARIRSSCKNFDKEGTTALRRAQGDLEYALYAIENQGRSNELTDEPIYCFSKFVDLTKATEILAQNLQRVSRMADATEARLAVATNNGPCTRMRQAMQLPSCKRQRSVGFA